MISAVLAESAQDLEKQSLAAILNENEMLRHFNF
jgi:hypothetical protein